MGRRRTPTRLSRPPPPSPLLPLFFFSLFSSLCAARCDRSSCTRLAFVHFTHHHPTLSLPSFLPLRSLLFVSSSFERCKNQTKAKQKSTVVPLLFGAGCVSRVDDGGELLRMHGAGRPCESRAGGTKLGNESAPGPKFQGLQNRDRIGIDLKCLCTLSIGC